MIFTYKWYKYNLNVICDKCNHPIPFQSVDGHPTCEECGNISDKTWLEAIDFSDIKKVNKYDDGSTSLMGFMHIEMNYNLVQNINCFHCHHVLKTPANAELSSIECTNCNNEIPFISVKGNELKNFVFYFHKNQKENPKGNIIAVHCVSCGAPLQADATKNEYTCNFCNTLNIVPPSLRAKKVLDDVYVGWKKIG